MSLGAGEHIGHVELKSSQVYLEAAGAPHFPVLLDDAIANKFKVVPASGVKLRMLSASA